MIIKKKVAVKKEEFLMEEVIRKLNKALILMEGDAALFDSRERGWNPAGTRLRKNLYLMVKAIQGFRKQVQETKNAEKA